MSDDRIIERLEALGRTHQSPPTPERVDSIESAVLTAISTAGPQPVGPARRRATVPVLLAVAALLVMFVVAAAWFTGGSDLTVQAYDGAVTIELPDGRTLEAEIGLDVPDGSLVEVGPDGSLLLGDDELGPGRYEIRDGQAVPNSAAAGTTTTTTTSPMQASPRPPAPKSSAVPDGDTGADPGLDGPPVVTATSVAPVRPTTTVSGDRPPPRTTLVDRPSSTAPVRRTTTTTTVAVDITRPTTTLAKDRPPSTTTTKPARTTTSTSSSLPADRGGERRDG